MLPERRLNQVESLLAEHSAQLDLHTAQLRRIAQSIQLITENSVRQSGSITFLLTEQAHMKTDVEHIKTNVNQVKQVQTQQTEMLTIVLTILQKHSDN